MSEIHEGLNTWKGYFELGIALCLYEWPILSTALISGWGGPDGMDKRDWMCGVIAEGVENGSLKSSDEVEIVLSQIMEDEFNVIVEDGSIEYLGKKIMTLCQMCKAGDIQEIEQWYKKWKNKSSTIHQSNVLNIQESSEEE